MRILAKRFIQSPTLTFKPLALISRIPNFTTTPQPNQNHIHILNLEEAASIIPQHKLKEFTQKKQASVTRINDAQDEFTDQYYSEESWNKIKEISKDTAISFSQKVRNHHNFVGIASEVLVKGYKFSRKEKPEKEVTITLEDKPDNNYIIQLAKSKIQAAEWANSRGNEATTTYMLSQAQKIAQKYPGLKITTIRGQQLLDEGFRLMHAVGRASQNEPVFVCLEWNGNPASQEYVGWVGKGVCFDAGGLNLKPTAGIAGMHNDKHGSCSVLSAMEGVASLGLKTNVVGVIGLVENFISANSYRPLDIITSRKGLTVQIGNTDAEGRLVLTDCMNWVQEKYKLTTMLELSTLTGAITIALGKKRAGVFTNSETLVQEILKVGEQVQELGWHMPLDDYHSDLIKGKQADITNSSGKAEGSSCQAAAFLKNFVEKGVEWAHIDIAAVSDSGSYSTGYGAKLLLHFLRNRMG